eukprot:gene4405-4661_t
MGDKLPPPVFIGDLNKVPPAGRQCDEGKFCSHSRHECDVEETHQRGQELCRASASGREDHGDPPACLAQPPDARPGSGPVKLYLGQGYDPDACHQGQTALGHAVEGGHAGVVAALLHGGARVDHPNAYGQTALHWACKRNEWDCFKALVGAGASAIATDSFGDTPGDVAALVCTNSDMMAITRQKAEAERGGPGALRHTMPSPLSGSPYGARLDGMQTMPHSPSVPSPMPASPSHLGYAVGNEVPPSSSPSCVAPSLCPRYRSAADLALSAPLALGNGSHLHA